jgi:hypothetical protein
MLICIIFMVIGKSSKVQLLLLASFLDSLKYIYSVDDMCSANADEPKVRRGKVPLRPEYVVADESGVASITHRRLQRLTPHGPDACIDSGAASAYFNREDVQAAIHVRNPGFCWAVCNTAKTWSYTSTRTNLPVNTYPYLVSNIQVLIYNGDWDACVPYTDGEGWTSSLNYPVKSAWHSWQFTSFEGNSNQVAGYAVEYDVSSLTPQKTTQRATNNNQHSFSFVTIKGGRHEVPESAPGQAIEMLKRLINNDSF